MDSRTLLLHRSIDSTVELPFYDHVEDADNTWFNRRKVSASRLCAVQLLSTNFFQRNLAVKGRGGFPVPDVTAMFLAINGRWSLSGQKRFHSSKKSSDCRSGKLKSLELGTVKGDGAMATASKHVRKLLDGLANQAETAPLTHKVRNFTRQPITA